MMQCVMPSNLAAGALANGFKFRLRYISKWRSARMMHFICWLQQCAFAPLGTDGMSFSLKCFSSSARRRGLRIGLWKYEAYQTESFVSSERGRRGLVLDLPWQRRTPQNRNLIVFVRFITDSGRKLETSLDIEVDPPTERIEDFKMLDPLAGRRSRPNAKSANSVQLPKWRPVR